MTDEFDSEDTVLFMPNGMFLFIDETTKFELSEEEPILTVDGKFNLRRTSKHSNKTHQASMFQKKKALKRILMDTARSASDILRRRT